MKKLILMLSIASFVVSAQAGRKGYNIRTSYIVEEYCHQSNHLNIRYCVSEVNKCMGYQHSLKMKHLIWNPSEKALYALEACTGLRLVQK